MNNSEYDIDFLKVSANIFLFFRKYFWIISISFTLGIAISLIKSHFSDTTYSSTLTATSVINGSTIIDLINSIDLITKGEEVLAIQEKYNLPDNFFSKIIKIEATENHKGLNQILISAQLNSENYFDTLSSGINTFLKNNFYVKQEIQLEQHGLKELIRKIDEEINDIDIAQDKQLKSFQNFIMLDKDQTINEQVNLLEKKIEIEKRMDLTTKPLIIIKNFDEVINNESYINSIFLGILFSIISILFIALIKLNKVAKNYISKE